MDTLHKTKEIDGPNMSIGDVPHPTCNHQHQNQ